jgi:hypothetical protein
MPQLAKGKTYGQVTDQNGKSLAGCRVELWDGDPDDDDFMGATVTDSNGRYEFRYPGGWDPRIPGSTSFRPDLYAKVYIKNGMGRWCEVGKSKTFANHKLKNDKKIDFQIKIEPRQTARLPFDFGKHAFMFPNQFQVRDLLGEDQFPGEVGMGLCGGMVAGALHRYQHGCSIPADTVPPHSGPLFDELLKRQLLTLEDGEIFKIWNWQRSPDLPHAHTPHSIRYMQKGEWKVLKGLIDAKKPQILCLIREEGYFSDIWKNHQVLAYGYEYEPTPRNLKVEVYDPNDRAGPSFLHMCLSGGRLGAHQIDSSGGRIGLRGFFVMKTTEKASKDHLTGPSPARVQPGPSTPPVPPRPGPGRLRR